MGLYGDLVHNSTIGYSSSVAPVFLTDTIFCYIAAASIQFFDTSKYTTDGSGDDSSTETILPQPFHCKRPISCLAVDCNTMIIAYTERGSKKIKLLQYPTLASFEIGSLDVPESDNTLDILQLRFSEDGLYLAVLTDLPTYQVHIWELKGGSLVCSSPVNPEPVDQLTFNPHNSKQLCTSCSDGGIDLWELEEGHRKFTLRHLPGTMFGKYARLHNDERLFVEAQDLHWTVQSHCWIDQNRVVASTMEGPLAVYDPAAGVVRVLALPDEIGGPVNTQNLLAMGNQILMWGRDGKVRCVQIQDDSAFVCQTFSAAQFAEVPIKFVVPAKNSIAITTEQGIAYLIQKDQSDQAKQIMETHAGHASAVSCFRDGNCFASGGSDGIVRIWDTNSRGLLHRFSVGQPVSTLACGPWSPMLVVGLSTGEIKVYDCDDVPRLVYHQLIHAGPVLQISFDPTGKYFASYSTVHGVVLTSVGEQIVPAGHLHTNGKVAGFCWKNTEEDLMSLEESVLFVLSNLPNKTSVLHRYVLALNRTENREINVQDLDFVAYTNSDTLHGVVVADSITGMETFFTFGLDRKLKVFALPPAQSSGSDGMIHLEPTSTEFEDHEKHFGGIFLGGNKEHVFTYSADGSLVVRSARESQNSFKVFAHDPYFRGTLHCTAERDCRVVVTVGGDSLVRIWDWSYSTAGKKIANDMTIAAESELEDYAPMIEEYVNDLRKAKTIEPATFDADVFPFTAPKAVSEESLENEQNEKEVLEAQERFLAGIQEIRKSLIRLLERNEKAPKLEQLSKEEFMLDVEEKARLEEQMNAKIQQVRDEINKKNCTKRVLFERFKREFWDSMDVVGRSLKSFLPDNLTDGLLDVSNYPLRKRSPEELKMLEKIKLRRKIQLALNVNKNATDSTGGSSSSNDPSEEQTLVGGDALIALETDSEVSKLLYKPFELTTTERRITQSYMLREMILDVKSEFNKLFLEKAKQKQDEIVKIEDRNERIREILKELQITEAVFSPSIHDDEAPERTLEVQDHEVKSEKYISPEEVKRLEELKRVEEERLRANQDDSRERALNDMMGGRLEDRTEEEQKEELIAPSFIDKPSADLTEDEKKAIKEYEMKVAAQKEEQQKRRKALETELRKLQIHVTDLCKAFDQSLKAFVLKKLEAEQRIFQMELQMVMLSQLTLLSEDDDAKERAILDKLDRLKQEKALCMREIPEIKNDLEIYREAYESAVKRDKEVERQFRKEVAVFDFYFDILIKLFKNREPAAEQPRAADDASSDLNGDATAAFSRLVYQKDAPEGLPNDVWEKVVSYRDKKLTTEREVQKAYKSFAELQNLVTSVLDNSERIRSETDEVVQAMNDFMEYKFHSTYNPRILFQLKQGQVEVPQAPVVTDYSDSVLIDRQEVEALNEVIVAMGSEKVDALTEMKDYRKGIHGLDWETKVLDFQAEDLVIRTRDIQLLRVTKEMQEFLRSGDKHRANAEVNALERRAEYNANAFKSKINEKKVVLQKLSSKVAEKETENSDLESQLGTLDFAISERNKILSLQIEQEGTRVEGKGLSKMMARRKLVDLSKAQANDIGVLRAELIKLRLKNFPNLPALKKQHV